MPAGGGGYRSRYCAKCQVSWPNDLPFIPCPVCSTPTTVHKDEHDFDSVEQAVAYKYQELEHREKREKFEAYYAEHATLELYTDLEAWTDADWAAQFAKLKPAAD